MSEARSRGREELLSTFAALLRASPHNLLSPRGLEELETRHLPESLAFAAQLPRSVRVLDVGSGGGLPGVVIAIAREDLEVHLLEATRKKVVFLTEAVDTLGLSVVIHHGRAEDLAVDPLRGSFDVVTARAVAPLERLVPWCAPYLRPGGRLFAIKGEQWQDEVTAANGSIEAAGMVVRALPASSEGASPERDGRPRVVILERARTPVAGP